MPQSIEIRFSKEDWKISTAFSVSLLIERGGSISSHLNQNELIASKRAAYSKEASTGSWVAKAANGSVGSV